MTSIQQRTVPQLPTPRPVYPESLPAATPAPESRSAARRAHSRQEYWDVTTASWRRCPPAAH